MPPDQQPTPYTGPTRRLRPAASDEKLRQMRLAMIPYVPTMALSEEERAEALRLHAEQQRRRREAKLYLVLTAVLLIIFGALVKVLTVQLLIRAGWDMVVADLIGTGWTLLPAAYIAHRVYRFRGW